MAPLGLSTAQALEILRDQLSSLLEQHQKLNQHRSSIKVRVNHVYYVYDCYCASTTSITSSVLKVSIFTGAMDEELPQS